MPVLELEPDKKSDSRSSTVLHWESTVWMDECPSRNLICSRSPPFFLPAESGAGPPQVIEGGQLLPESIGLARGRLEVSFRSVEQLAEVMYVLARILEGEGDAFAAAYEPETEPESPDTGDVRELLDDLEAMEASEALRGQEPRCL